VRRVLITGATGFIGRHLWERCEREGYAVRSLARSGSMRGLVPRPPHEIVEGDVRDARAMRAATRDIDVVFHLAGLAHIVSSRREDDSAYREVNVAGTRNVLDGAIAAGTRAFVFFSSVKAMGERTRGCADETTPERPETAYGRTKLEAERLVLESGRRTEMRVSCLRPALVYGPGIKGNLLRMIAAIDRGRLMPLADTGALRSIVHVTNLVDAALLTAENASANGQCYIVVDDEAYSTRTLADVITRALGREPVRWSIPVGLLRPVARVGDVIGWTLRRPFPLDSDTLAKLIKPAWYSAARITRDIGWRPKLTLEQALPELVDWYRSRRS
jgi:nucleoside-diphosphate-sugar epimerase